MKYKAKAHLWHRSGGLMLLRVEEEEFDDLKAAMEYAGKKSSYDVKIMDNDGRLVKHEARENSARQHCYA